jgi:hypothetical protein
MDKSELREAVGLFHDENQLQAAADELLVSGFDYSDLSLLAAHRVVEDRLGHIYRRAADLEDDPHVAIQAYMDRDSRVEGQSALVGGLVYVGAVAAAGLVVASGGTMAALIAGAAAGGGGGGLIGTFLARFIGQHHARYLQEHLDKGGLLLWVRAADADHERRAIEILRRNGAEDAHGHTLPEPEYSFSGDTSKRLSFMNRLGL